MTDAKGSDDRKRAAALADDVCTLDECPPGLFLFNGGLFFKSEYATETQAGVRQVDAYCIESGEYFWGGASSSKERAALPVRPVSLSSASAFLAYAAAPAVSADLRERVREAIETSYREDLFYDQSVDVVIAAISAAGYVNCPSEPTEAMIEAATAEAAKRTIDISDDARNILRAALATGAGHEA